MSVLSEIRDTLQGILRRRTEGLYYTSITVPGIAAADAFDANDAVGGLFFIPVPVNGIIETAKLIDPDDDTLALTVHLFTRTVTVAASDAAFTISANDALYWVTSITFDTPIVDIGSAKVSEKSGSTHYYAPLGYLWAQCSTTGTPTIAAERMPVIQLGIRVEA